MVVARRICYTLLTMLSLLFSANTFAADALPKIDCTLTDSVAADGTTGDAQDTFTKTTPLIYLVCTSDEVKKGQRLKSEWIAADTNNVAPPNYKIDEKTFTVDKDLADDQDWTVTFSLSKPTKGWPPGSYHVDVYVDDQLDQSTKFKIE